jgi:hypothetical protein
MDRHFAMGAARIVEDHGDFAMTVIGTNISALRATNASTKASSLLATSMADQGHEPGHPQRQRRYLDGADR